MTGRAVPSDVRHHAAPTQGSLIALGFKAVEPDHGRRRNDCDDADRTSTLRWQLL